MPIFGPVGAIAGGDVSAVHATVAPSAPALEEPLMTHNGPYPGPPSQPWSGGDSHEPYTEPADPWGDHPASAAPEPGWGTHPTSMHPAPESSVGYPAPDRPSPSLRRGHRPVEDVVHHGSW